MSISWLRMMAVGAVLAMVIGLAGCSDDEDEPAGPTPVSHANSDSIMAAFQRAYRLRDADMYAQLLADDFRFFFDPATRQQLGIESWDRMADSVHTGALFESPEVTKIVIDLKYPFGDMQATGPERSTWRLKRITDVYLDVDFMPIGQPEPTTFRVEDQTQSFYFRRGRTAADTLSGSPTSGLWYLVEWRDHGTSGGGALQTTNSDVAGTWSRIKGIISTPATSALESTTWSGIKALLNKPTIDPGRTPTSP